ncbi:MAG: hypothetical protein AAF151_26140 [Cyanobacteria bacterium J06656_5]
MRALTAFIRPMLEKIDLVIREHQNSGKMPLLMGIHHSVRKATGQNLSDKVIPRISDAKKIKQKKTKVDENA